MKQVNTSPLNGILAILAVLAILTLSACSPNDCPACSGLRDDGISAEQTYTFGLCVSNLPDATETEEGCDAIVVTYRTADAP